MTKKLQLGLFGFGCVGQGLHHVLQQTHGVKAEIRRIAVKHRDKPRSLPADLFCFDPSVILNDPEIDVVVELIDDAAVAFDIVKQALRNGKHVVTANKRMLAEHLEEIYQLQHKYDRSVLYEGAVCGSIPIIRNLEEYYDNDLLNSVEGIFNGSTNYILTKVFEEGKGYAEALRAAQELGFAESDPSLDVQGFDPKFKLVITLAHAFGVFVKPDDIVNIGIDKLSSADLKYARDNGYTIKLVARAIRQGEQVISFVAPQYIPAHHFLAPVRNEFNAVVVNGAFAENQIFVGKGAGSYPTGAAVLSDISALAFGYRYAYKKRQQADHYQFTNRAWVDVSVSFQDRDALHPRDFEDFKGGRQALGYYALEGSVSLDTLRAWRQRPGLSVVLAPGSSPVLASASQPASSAHYA